MTRFRCHRNGADTGRFIDGKIYDAVATEGSAFVVRDEIGRARVVTGDERNEKGHRSTHLVKFLVPLHPRGPERQEPVGWFEKLEEETRA